MEYLTFGKALERCRFRFLKEVTGAQSALVLGDGDGRFAAELLRRSSLCRVHAIDGSLIMLQTLQARCGADTRVATHFADLTVELPAPVRAESFDLITTHFFLDCLTTAEVEVLIARVRPLLRPGACWVVSEFDIPGGVMRMPSALIVRGLYLCFRALTGLRTQRLPDYRAAMERAGLVCRTRVIFLGGLLVSELWIQDNPSALEA